MSTDEWISALESGWRQRDPNAIASLFTDDAYYEKLDHELGWLAEMRDEGVRSIAARTVGLSSQAKEEIVARADELRRQEHLDN